MCSEWKMASSSSSSSSRRKKQEVALARTDHYEDEEVESSMLQARGLGAVTQGIYKIFGFTTGSEDYRETPEDIFDEGKEDNEDTDEIINDAYQKELLEATNKSANSQANEIAAIIENNVVENTKKSYVSTINKFIVWLTARKALLETQRRKLENLINARKQKSHVAENVNESGHPPLEDNLEQVQVFKPQPVLKITPGKPRYAIKSFITNDCYIPGIH